MVDLGTTVDLLHLFADPTRLRLVALLAQQELTVAEITAVTELAQSRVSTHLGKLREADVLRDRKVGPSTFYSLDEAAMPEAARRVWTLVREDVRDGVLDADRGRCEAVVRARTHASRWPDAIAGEMERHYSPGRTWESLARGVLGLARLRDVLDIGCGDGAIAELLAPRARSITCVDVNERMIAAARERLRAHEHAELLVADAHELPFPGPRFDQVLLFNVLTHVRAPERVVAEAARVLRPAGTLAVVALAAHEHPEVTASYDHVHAGVAPQTLRGYLERARLVVERCEVTSRERRPPNFHVISAFAHAPSPAARSVR